MSRQLDTAYAYIKQRINDGTFRPSQKLNEVELSDLIGVSRNTVKKALLTLEQENLVKLEKNKGATIKAFSLEEVINYLEIREVLEGLTIKSAVANMSESLLQQLEEIQKDREIFLQQDRYDECSRLSTEFYNTIYSVSKNKEAIKLLKIINNQLKKVYFRTVLVPGKGKETHQEFNTILEALKEKDVDKSIESIKVHIANLRKTIEDNHQYVL